MSYKVEEIEGVGPANAKKLAAAKIISTDDLLKTCADPKGRKSVSEITGLSEGQILNLTNMADLMRVKGVGSQFSELLKASGVDTIKELATRNSENLAAKMKDINDKKKLARSTPAVSDVEKWVSEAKKIDPRITY